MWTRYKSFAKQKSVICAVDTANEPISEEQEDEEAFHREVIHELMKIKDSTTTTWKASIPLFVVLEYQAQQQQ